MRTGTILTATAAAVGLAAVVRQRREAAAVRDGRLARIGGPAGSVEDQGEGRMHAAIASWFPSRPTTPLGRLVAALWASPLTALGLAAATSGGVRPAWDDRHGALVAPAVGGPFGLFLRTQSASAATLGQVVGARRASLDDALLAHEAMHVRQQERLGLLFAAAYPVASAVWGYRRNPFEVAARRAASGVSGPAARP